MPYFLAEYSKNLPGLTVSEMLIDARAVLLSYRDDFPATGIRCRAIGVDHFAIGEGDDVAYIYVRLRVRPGRPKELLTEACQKLLAVVRRHAERAGHDGKIGITIEYSEFDDEALFRASVP